MVILRRASLIPLLLVGISAFLVISFFLARGLVGTNAERQAVVDLVRAQVGGNADRALAMVPECRSDPKCVRAMRRRVTTLRQAGKLQVLSYQPSMQLALKKREGIARVAWRIDGEIPKAQCVGVARTSLFNGSEIELLSISDPLSDGKGCT